MIPLPQYEDLHQHDLHPSSPAYAPEVSSCEHTLPLGHVGLPAAITEPLALDSEQLWSPTHSYVYGGSMASISLGQRFWGSRHPAFGVQSMIRGVAKLTSKCTYAHRVTVTLKGRVVVAATFRGQADSGNMLKKTIVSKTVVIPKPDGDEFYPTNHAYMFSIPFPPCARDVVTGNCNTLPPTYFSWAPGMSCEVSYTLQVDVSRKGLRRHQGTTIPIHYLPKSWPSLPPFRGSIMTAPHDVLKTIRLVPAWQGSKTKVAGDAVVPSVLVSVPVGSTISSGHRIPIKVTIRSQEAPALAKLFAQGIDVRLTKRVLVLVRGNASAGRDIAVSTGVVAEVNVGHEGVATAHVEIEAGEAGKEQSWIAEGLLEVVYFFRIAVRVPEGACGALPSFLHDERVEIATEPWGTREREELQLGGISAPALGMLNRQRELASYASVS